MNYSNKIKSIFIVALSTLTIFFFAACSKKIVITFDVNGGEFVSSTQSSVIKINAKSALGDKIPEVTRSYYNLKHWEYLGSPYVTSVKIPTSSTLRAIWEPISYFVEYNLDSGVNNIDNVSVYTVLSGTVEFKAPTKSGYAFLGWYNNSQFTGDPISSIVASEVHSGISLYAKWGNPAVVGYLVTLVYNNGTVNGSVYSNTQGIVTQPSDPIKATDDTYEYTFSGWYKEETFVNSVNWTLPISGDITYYAKYNQISLNTPRYSVTFNDNVINEIINVPNAIPNIVQGTPINNINGYGNWSISRTGYEFLGWSLSSNGASITGTENINNNITLYAKWGIPTVSSKQVSLDTNLFTSWGVGSIHDTIIKAYNNQGNVIDEYNLSGTTPITLTSEVNYYVFEFKDSETTWYSDKIFWLTIPSVSKIYGINFESQELDCKKFKIDFGPLYTLIYKNEGGDTIETIYRASIVEGAGYAEVPKESDDTYDYIFLYWSYSPALIEGYLQSNTVATPVYEPTVAGAISVTWKNDSGSETLSITKNVTSGAKPVYNGETPTKTSTAQYSYIFVGWNASINQETGVSPENLPDVLASITYYVAFTKVLRSYTVTWKNDQEVLETDINQIYGTTPIYNGLEPTKTHYIFAGWSIDGETLLDSIPAVDGEIIFYAYFNQEYKTIKLSPYLFSGWGSISELKLFAVIDSADTILEFTEGVVQVPYGTSLKLKFYENSDAWEMELGSWDSLNSSLVLSGFDQFDGQASPKTAVAVFIPFYYIIIDLNQWSAGTTIPLNKIDQEVKIKVRIGITYPEYSLSENVDGVYKFYMPSTVSGIEAIVKQIDSGGDNGDKTSTWSDITFNKDLHLFYGGSWPEGKWQLIPSKSVKIEWYNDSELVREDNVFSNKTVVTAPEGDFVRPANAQYTYTFIGWSTDPDAIEGDVVPSTFGTDTIYYAIYSKVVNQYTITYRGYDDSELEVKSEVDYGTISLRSETPTKPNDGGVSYIFVRWIFTPALVEGGIIGDTVATPEFTSKSASQFVARFYSQDGLELLHFVVLESGLIPGYSGDQPEKAETAQYIYSFNGWATEINQTAGNTGQLPALTQDISYYATFLPEVRNYTVKWYIDSNPIETDFDTPYGSSPSFDGGTPSKEFHQFLGWSTDGVHVISQLPTVDGDTNYYAVFQYVKAITNYGFGGWGTITEVKIIAMVNSSEVTYNFTGATVYIPEATWLRFEFRENGGLWKADLPSWSSLNDTNQISGVSWTGDHDGYKSANISLS